MHWSTVAIATRAAGVPVHSGTVPVERLWSCLESMLPEGARAISPRWFNVLSNLMLLRYNFQHFSARSMPGLAERDSLLAQRINTLSMLARAASDRETDAATSHLQPLFDPFVAD